MNQTVPNDQINSLLAKCWTDEGFKQRLLTDTHVTLKAEGVELPAGYTVQVLENTEKVINYVLPPNPNAELSDSELESVAGGKNGAVYFAPIGLSTNLGQGGHGIHNMHLSLDEARAQMLK